MSIPLQVEGNAGDLKPNPAMAGRPLAFEHRDHSGTVVKWTDSVPKCDKPSLAGDVTYCGLNSRLNRVVKDNVEWLFVCRKSSESMEVSAERSEEHTSELQSLMRISYAVFCLKRKSQT